MQKKLFLSLFLTALLLSSCGHIQVPNTEFCTVAGTVSAGAICAETITHKTRDMTFDEFLIFLEPTDQRGGALCQSADDYNELKTTLEQACRLLGTRCSYEMKRTIQGMEKMLNVRK